MIRRPPKSTRVRSSAASDVYKRQIDSHSITIDSFCQRGPAYRRHQQINIATEKPVGVGVQADALGQAEMASGSWLNEKVNVRIGPEVRPGRRAKGEDAFQAIFTGECAQASTAWRANVIAETAKRSGVEVAVAGAVW